MSKAKHSILAQRIGPLASEFGPALEQGRVTEAVIGQFVDALAGLPAGMVSQVDIWLPWQAGLHRRPGAGVFYGDRLKRHPRIAWLFLFHRDGYVREAALDSLTEPPPSSFFVAALALRMNDWVEPVALAATRRFAKLLLASSPAVVIASGSFLLDRWRYWRRWSEQSSMLLDALYSRPDVVLAFVDHLHRETRGPLGRELTKLLRETALDPHLARLAIEARSPVVRAIALKTQIEGRASWPCGFENQWIDKVYGISRRVLLFDHREIEIGMLPADAIRLGLTDRSVFVRRMAADALTQRPDIFDDIGTLISTMSSDRSPSIRDRADYLLRHLAKA